MTNVFTTQGSLSVACVDGQIVLVQRARDTTHTIILSPEAIAFLLPILEQVKG